MPVPAANVSSLAGSIRRVTTLRPCCGPTVTRYVIEARVKVPWRLYAMTDDELAEIFSPETYHQPILAGVSGLQYPSGMGPGEGFRLPFRRDYGHAMLCDPRKGYAFMQQEQLIGRDEKATLRNITAWMRDRLSHGSFTPDDARPHTLLKDRLEAFAHCGLARCDFTDYGWDVGGWRKGDRENVNPEQASQEWNAYFESKKDEVMSDGLPY